jgi:hypothetical protein
MLCMKMIVLWDVVFSNMIETDRRFGKITDVFPENDSKPINALCSKNSYLMNVLIQVADNM